MTTSNHIFHSFDDLENFLKSNFSNQEHLVQVYSSMNDKKLLKEICDLISQYYKNITGIVSKKIIHKKVKKNRILVTVTHFEKSKVKINYYKNSLKIDEKAKTNILYTTEHNINNSHNNVVGACVKELLFNKDIKKGYLVISFYGDDLQVYKNHSLGFYPVGRDMEVTEVKNNRVVSIDNIPIKELYLKYLNSFDYEKIKHFPFLIKKGDLFLVRYLKEIHKDNSVSFFINVKKGDKFSFSLRSIDKMSTKLGTIYNSCLDMQIETLFIFSNINRKEFFDGVVKTEFKELNSITSVSGFNSYSEILDDNLLNLSTLFLGLSEKDTTKSSKLLNLKQKNSSSMVNYLLSAISQDGIKSYNLLTQYKYTIENHLIVSKTDPKGIITFVNQEFCKISKYTKEELIGKNHNIVRDPEVPSQMFQKLWNEIKQGKVFRATFSNLDKLGNKYYVNSVISPIFDEYGEIMEYISIRQDVTELKNALEEAKIAKDIKSKFVANISHEIRTPLNAVIGFSDLLNNSELNRDQKRYLNLISSGASTLLGLVNDVLDFSKLEENKLELENIEFSLDELLDAIKLFEIKANEKHIDFKIRYSNTIPRKLIGDFLRIKQVISNLINNAVKFTPESGKVYISILTKELRNDKITVRISVKDTGIGIKKENQDKIFEAFSQEDVTTSRKYGGTGLGLSISSNILEMMNSELKLKSEPNNGSRFYFDLTLGYVHEYSKQKKEESGMSFKGKVLVVEDDAINTELMREILKNLYISADFVYNGKEAIEVLKNNKNYSLILMDINMPIMNGIDATKEIRKFSDITIIALTANAIKEDVDNYKSIGMNDVLTKPLNLKKLQEVLNKYSSQDKALQLKQFSNELGVEQEVFNSLLNMYQTSLSVDFEKLKDYYKDEDYYNLRNRAHKIKGSSANMRFGILSKVASEIEEIAKTKENLDKLPEKMEKIGEEVKEVLSYEV